MFINIFNEKIIHIKAFEALSSKCQLALPRRHILSKVNGNIIHIKASDAFLSQYPVTWTYRNNKSQNIIHIKASEALSSQYPITWTLRNSKSQNSFHTLISGSWRLSVQKQL